MLKWSNLVCHLEEEIILALKMVKMGGIRNFQFNARDLDSSNDCITAGSCFAPEHSVRASLLDLSTLLQITASLHSLWPGALCQWESFFASAGFCFSCLQQYVKNSIAYDYKSTEEFLAFKVKGDDYRFASWKNISSVIKTKQSLAGQLDLS